MDEENCERLEPPEAPDLPGDRLRQRIAEARESIGRSLRDVVERLEERPDVAARAAEEQITRRAKERLDAAIADFEARGRVIRDGSDLPRLGRAQEIERLAQAFGVEPV